MASRPAPRSSSRCSGDRRAGILAASINPIGEIVFLRGTPAGIVLPDELGVTTSCVDYGFGGCIKGTRGDFDGDGRDDLALSSNDCYIDFIRGTGEGAGFERGAILESPGLFRPVAAVPAPSRERHFRPRLIRPDRSHRDAKSSEVPSRASAGSIEREASRDDHAGTIDAAPKARARRSESSGSHHHGRSEPGIVRARDPWHLDARSPNRGPCRARCKRDGQAPRAPRGQRGISGKRRCRSESRPRGDRDRRGASARLSDRSIRKIYSVAVEAEE